MLMIAGDLWSVKRCDHFLFSCKYRAKGPPGIVYAREIFSSRCDADHKHGRSLPPQPLTGDHDRDIVFLSRAVVSHHGALATD